MSRLAALSGLVGPSHNGGVLATMSTYRLAEEDAARRAWLDEKTAVRPRKTVPAKPKNPSWCMAPGCERRSHGGGLCAGHAAQFKRRRPFTRLRAYVRRGPR